MALTINLTEILVVVIQINLDQHDKGQKASYPQKDLLAYILHGQACFTVLIDFLQWNNEVAALLAS